MSHVHKLHGLKLHDWSEHGLHLERKRVDQADGVLGLGLEHLSVVALLWRTAEFALAAGSLHLLQDVSQGCHLIRTVILANFFLFLPPELGLEEGNIMEAWLQKTSFSSGVLGVGVIWGPGSGWGG